MVPPESTGRAEETTRRENDPGGAPEAGGARGAGAGEETAGFSQPGEEANTSISEAEADPMSESLIVQVGDSLCERNEKILDTTDTTTDRDEAEDKSEEQLDK